MTGRINSFQSLGTVDGPGVRYVVFMQGCPLRCIYCHNPETWNIDEGNEYTSDQIVEQIMRYKDYFGKEGGVTVSGGEAMLQWEFVAELFEKLHKNGIHTALDTSGSCNVSHAEEVLKNTDLVICDIKFLCEDEYNKYTKGSINTVLEFLKKTENSGTDLWIRHVVVPGMTDIEDYIRKISNIAHQYSNLKKIELLPFRKLCVSKYENLQFEFPLKETEECSTEKIYFLYNFL